MRRRSPIVTVIAVLLALCATGAAPAAASAAPRCTGADVAPAQMTRSAARQAVLCLLNRRRAARGLPRLRPDQRLRTAARRHSVHMARAGFFSHTSPSGATMTQRITRAGYTRQARSWVIGENIAWGAGPRATPRQIVSAWMQSPGHRANILERRYREIGIGVVLGAPVRLAASSFGATYTTDFGMRR